MADKELNMAAVLFESPSDGVPATWIVFVDENAEEDDVVEKALNEMHADGEEFFQQFTKDCVLRVVTASERWLMEGFKKLRGKQI